MRVARIADVPAIASLRAAWDGVASDPGFERRVADWLRAEGGRRTIWLAERDGAAVGMATVLEYRRMPRPGRQDAAWGYIGTVFVHVDHRWRGTGAALLSEIVESAEERGYARLVVRPSAEAVSLYVRAGFVPADGSEGDLLLVRSGR